MFGDQPEIGEYLRSTSMPMTPTLTVSIGKIDNGYVLKLNTIPKRKMPRAVASPFAGMDPDEMIDKIVDGMGALIRSINDKGAGEDWKDGEDRVKVREGFKAMFPSLVPPPIPKEEDTTFSVNAVIVDDETPRSESRVFESKADLIKYLSEQL
jgi:hypothetical protein